MRFIANYMVANADETQRRLRQRADRDRRARQRPRR
jgi:hypothetical protein